MSSPNLAPTPALNPIPNLNPHLTPSPLLPSLFIPILGQPLKILLDRIAEVGGQVAADLLQGLLALLGGFAIGDMLHSRGEIGESSDTRQTLGGSPPSLPGTRLPGSW